MSEDSEYSYALAAPLNGADPSGQLYVRLIDKGNYKCGRTGSATFHYLLDQDAPCEGYLVQKIEVYCVVEDCNCECPVSVFDQDSSPPSEPDVVFYEAMILPAGTKAKQGRPDSSSLRIPADSCGVSYTVGTVKFFCKNPADSPNGVGTGDLLSAGWGAWRGYVGKCSAKTSGGYISIDGKAHTPRFWKDQPVERSAWRRAGASWNCCRGDSNFVAEFTSWDPGAWSGA